jgi:hypothetical protein
MRQEILSGPERRRRWSVDEKVRILAEAEVEGSGVADIARRHLPVATRAAEQGLAFACAAGVFAGPRIRCSAASRKAASGSTDYVRDDRPWGGSDPPGRPTTSHQTARENTRGATSPRLAVYSKPMLTAGSRNFTLLELMARPESARRRVGRICAATFMTCGRRSDHRLPRKLSIGSAPFTTSNAISPANPPRYAGMFGRTIVGR